MWAVTKNWFAFSTSQNWHHKVQRASCIYCTTHICIDPSIEKEPTLGRLRNSRKGLIVTKLCVAVFEVFPIRNWAHDLPIFGGKFNWRDEGGVTHCGGSKGRCDVTRSQSQAWQGFYQRRQCSKGTMRYDAPLKSQVHDPVVLKVETMIRSEFFLGTGCGYTLPSTGTGYN